MNRNKLIILVKSSVKRNFKDSNLHKDVTITSNLSCVPLNIRVNKVCDEPKYFEAYIQRKDMSIVLMI